MGREGDDRRDDYRCKWRVLVGRIITIKRGDGEKRRGERGREGRGEREGKMGREGERERGGERGGDGERRGERRGVVSPGGWRVKDLSLPLPPPLPLPLPLPPPTAPKAAARLAAVGPTLLSPPMADLSLPSRRDTGVVARGVAMGVVTVEGRREATGVVTVEGRGDPMGVVTVEVGVEPVAACLRLLASCFRSSAISAGDVPGGGGKWVRGGGESRGMRGV